MILILMRLWLGRKDWKSLRRSSERREGSEVRMMMGKKKSLQRKQRSVEEEMMMRKLEKRPVRSDKRKASENKCVIWKLKTQVVQKTWSQDPIRIDSSLTSLTMRMLPRKMSCMGKNLMLTSAQMMKRSISVKAMHLRVLTQRKRIRNSEDTLRNLRKSLADLGMILRISHICLKGDLKFLNLFLINCKFFLIFRYSH